MKDAAKSSDAPAGGARPAELTLPVIVLGLILSVVMGAANVYLGLKAGMTVSASIPAAVIAMGVLRGVLRRDSILEANLVQTAASAGESLAAGIIFTMPALILAGIWTDFDFWTTSLIALAGGLFGILLMIPMRRVFIVDNKELKYPEGVACAEVLRAGAHEQAEEEAGGMGLLAVGIMIGALVKMAISYLGLLKTTVEAAVRSGGRILYYGVDISPALLAVGFIVGLPIAVQIFIGGAIGWLIGIPLLGDAGLDPLHEPLIRAAMRLSVPLLGDAGLSAPDAAWELWKNKIRYMGVGAMLVGGVASIWQVRGGLVSAVREVFHLFRSDGSQAQLDERDRNLSGKTIVGLGLVCVLLIAGLYFELLKHDIGLSLLTTGLMIAMSFFFAAVASYIVGLVGNSNSPVSGMTITAVLGTGLLIMLFGFEGEAAIIATLGVAGVVCCVACTSGDVCNDLKTGHIVGASPRRQQAMQVMGVLVAAFVMAPVMTVLHEGSLNDGTGGIGGRVLPAPQANLFASLAKGFFGDEQLPRDMIVYGIGIGVALLVMDWILRLADAGFRLHVMPVAVGMYLPFGLATPILVGGLLSALVGRRRSRELRQKRGVLLSSGIIAGESLIGVFLGILTYLEFKSHNLLDASTLTGNLTLNALSIATMVFVAVMVYVLAGARMTND